MDKQQLDNLWQLYREFCLMCNQSDMVNTTAEFLAWIEKFKFHGTNKDSKGLNLTHPQFKKVECARCITGDITLDHELFCYNAP